VAEVGTRKLTFDLRPTTMAVEIQTMPSMNGFANGDADMDDGVKDGALRFTSGMILPPPEIKCEQAIAFNFVSSQVMTDPCQLRQPLLTERHSSLPVPPILLSSRTKFARISALILNSLSSTLPTHIMHITDTEWTGFHRVIWVMRMLWTRKARQKLGVRLSPSFKWMLGRSRLHQNSSWSCLTSAPLTCESRILSISWMCMLTGGQGHHETDGTLHCSKGPRFLGFFICTRRAKLSIRLFEAESLAFRILQSASGTILEGDKPEQGSIGSAAKAHEGRCTI